MRSLKGATVPISLRTSSSLAGCGSFDFLWIRTDPICTVDGLKIDNSFELKLHLFGIKLHILLSCPLHHIFFNRRSCSSSVPPAMIMFTVGTQDTKFCRRIHRGITLTILSAQGGGLGPLLSPLIVLFCSLFRGGVRIFVKSTWQDRIAWKFFFPLTPNSPCFRQLKRFTAQKRALQHSRVRNNMDLSFIVDDFWLQKVF